MNILFLTREYEHEYLPSSGGSGVFYARLAKSLVAKGHHVFVFGVNRTNVSFNDEGVEVTFRKNLFLTNKILNLARSVTRKISWCLNWSNKICALEKKNAAKLLIKHINGLGKPIDIIETHDFEGLSLYISDEIPYCIRCHGSYSILHHSFGYNEDKGKIYCEIEAFKKAKNFIAVSRYSEMVNAQFFNVQNFKLIYNGINIQTFANKHTETISKSIFHFGNTSPEKGADISLNVFMEVLKSEPNATLHFLGSENYYKKTLEENIQKNHLTNKVIFHGMQSAHKVVEILSKADVVIFPSKGETFGLGLCEAMALQKPVIAADINSFNEIIENNQNGHIAKNKSEYAQIILDLFSDPQLAAKVGKNARNTIDEKFNEIRMVEETLDYYQDIIKKCNN